MLQHPLIISIILTAIVIGVLFGAAAMAVRAYFKDRQQISWISDALGFSFAALVLVFHVVNLLYNPDSHSTFPYFELSAVLACIFAIFGVYLRKRSDRVVREAEQVARSNQAIFQAVLDNAPFGIVVRDLEGRFRLANRVYKETFSIGGDVNGKDSFDLLPEDVAAEAKEQDQELIQLGKPVLTEVDGQTDKGAGRLLLARFPVRDDDGMIVGAGRIGIDITELHATRLKLAEQQELFELALSRGNVGIWRWNIETDQKFISRNWEIMAGCGTDESITTMEDWIARLTPHLRDEARARLRTYCQAEGEVTCEYIVEFENGKLFWLESRVIPVFDDNRKIAALIGVDADITERKLAEQALQEREVLLSSIFDNIPVSLLIKDNERRFESQNRTYTDWYGKTPQELSGFKYEELDDFQSKAEGDAARSQERDVLLTGKIVERELERQFADGSSHRVRITKFPIRDQSGAIIKVGSIGVDLTELYQTQRALEEANIRLEKANSAKSEFLAHMSHELRTPLNSIIGFAQMISEQQLGKVENAAYLEYAGLINTSAQHLLSVINDILDISKVEAGEMQLAEEPLNIRRAVEQSVKLISPRSQSKGHAIHLEIDDSVPELLADARIFQQILLNLLSNAVKFTTAGGDITITAGVLNSGAMEVVVGDNGIGIASEDIPRVLEPFGQVRSSAAISFDGTGLGLSLSRKLMNLHDGTLEIDSASGIGTKVRLLFPPHRVAASNDSMES